MNKTTMNSLTTFMPILIIPLACIFLVFTPYFNTKKIGINLALTAFPIQGLFIILRKNVFLKHWLGKKEKIFDGLLWIAAGSIIIFLYLNKPTFTGTWESTTSDLYYSNITIQILDNDKVIMANLPCENIEFIYNDKVIVTGPHFDADKKEGTFDRKNKTITYINFSETATGKIVFSHLKKNEEMIDILFSDGSSCSFIKKK
ncbi:MAG: hypothetical protein J6P28_02800 [Treponema sp.]|nr:hypothetical protein [Treponema sp.]